jgi:hypothetical protein
MHFLGARIVNIKKESDFNLLRVMRKEKKINKNTHIFSITY